MSGASVAKVEVSSCQVALKQLPSEKGGRALKRPITSEHLGFAVSCFASYLRYCIGKASAGQRLPAWACTLRFVKGMQDKHACSVTIDVSC